MRSTWGLKYNTPESTLYHWIHKKNKGHCFSVGNLSRIHKQYSIYPDSQSI